MESVAKSTKLLIPCLLEVHNEKMSSVHLFQIIGLGGLERSSCFSIWAIKMTEKATAIFVPLLYRGSAGGIYRQNGTNFLLASAL